jgi:hypothetical protein
MTVVPLLFRCMPCCRIITISEQYYVVLGRPMCVDCMEKTKR